MKIKKKGNWINGFINFRTEKRLIELNWSLHEWGIPVCIHAEKGYFEFRVLFIALIVL